MEEAKPRPGLPGDRSQAAAEKLRALRERANRALDDHRRRLGEIETQLSDRVRRLADDFGAPLAAPSPAPSDDRRDAELAALRQQLDQERTKHEQFLAQLHDARLALAEIQSQPCAACQRAEARLAAADQELAALREQIEGARRQHEDDCARHDNFLEQLTAARQAITVLQHSAGESTAGLRAELEALRAQQLAAAEQLSAAQRDLDLLHQECDAERARAEALQLQLAEATVHGEAPLEQIAALEAELQQSRDETAELRRQFADVEAQVAQLEGGAAAETQALVEQLAAAESQTEALRKQLAEAEGERLKLALSSAEVESVVAELRKGLAAAEKRAQAAEARAIEAEHHAAAGADAAELREQLAAALAAAEERTQLTQGLQETLEEARRELDELRATMAPRAEFERLQQELQARVELVEQLQQASAAHETAVAALEAEVARLHSATAAGEERLRAASVERDQARAELAEVEQNSRPASELAEVQQKFDLALADVRKLKREIEGLREELASRPAAAGDAAPELVALRTERDALAARVAELETQYAAGANAADADAQQELADLQRRFEMAVDDVRQLKQENAQLREQIASQVAATPSAAAGGTDWAAQRARLMALLEEEEGSGELDPQRTAERVDIEQAIAATDRAVAEKDQRIAELQAALEASHAGRADAQAEADVARVLDADSVVAAERERLAALTAEWEEKVRAAELEFSVERAKLAREQAALREKMFEMEKLHPAPTQGDDGGDPHKPRRRWLSALGLQDDGDVGKSRK